eukprot:1074569-Amorphochlora_amoeboformis.AAC.1
MSHQERDIGGTSTRVKSACSGCADRKGSRLSAHDFSGFCRISVSGSLGVGMEASILEGILCFPAVAGNGEHRQGGGIATLPVEARADKFSLGGW